MNLQTLKNELNRLQQLIDGWQTVDQISPIERDLALAQLRELYAALRWEAEARPTAVETTDPMPTEEPTEEVADEALEEVVAIDAAALLALDALSEVSDTEPTEEPALAPIEEPVEEAEPALIEEEPAPVFELDPAPVGENPAPSEEAEAATAEEPESLLEDSVEEPEPADEEDEPAADPVTEPIAAKEPAIAIAPIATEEPAEEEDVPVEEEPIAEPATAAEVPTAATEETAVAVEEPILVVEELTAPQEPTAASAEEPVEPQEPTEASAEEPKLAVQTLFGEEEEAHVRHRHKQRVIMSLYDTVPEQHPKRRETKLRIEHLIPPESAVRVVHNQPEVIEMSEEELTRPHQKAPITPAVEEHPQQAPIEAEPTPSVVIAAAEEPSPAPTLGEAMPRVQTLGEKLAAERETVAEVHREPITDLRRAVGINDKFLLIRDLFGGNGSLYEITIRRLNEFDNLDDCLIYIAEHFTWNPNSDGAQLMMELLERKYLG